MSSKENFPKNCLKFVFLILILPAFVLGIFLESNFNFFEKFNCQKYHLNHINPAIKCDQDFTIDKKNYTEFKNKLIEFIEDKKTEGEISMVSVYFRDLQYGPTFGIDEYAKFSPASLLKLPMMIAYLNLSENKPDFLQTKIYFEGYKGDIRQSITPKFSAKEGTHYTLYELIEYMIKYSDNNSYYALLAYLDQISPNVQILRETFIDLGIIDPKSNLDETITVKSYGSIFTQLFNSSYFSQKETSEEALDFLLDTDFKEGLVAGLPPYVDVAHKFGERFSKDNDIKQLHDCGIVYYPGNPYLLCVMTRGNDMEKLKQIIGEISKMTYEEFNSRRID